MNLLEYLINTSIANGGKVRLVIKRGTIKPEERTTQIILPLPLKGVLGLAVVADDDDDASETIAEGASTIYDYSGLLDEPIPGRIPQARCVVSYVNSGGTALTRNIGSPVESVDGEIVLAFTNRYWSEALTYKYAVYYTEEL